MTQEAFNRFSEAVSEIATAEVEACSGPTPPTIDDIPSIAERFLEEVQIGPRSRDTEEIRALYGAMVCISRSNGTSERKRRDSVDCPAGGLAAVETAKEFFACLGPSELEPVFGLDAVSIFYPCVAFVIDTTGSMAEEIEDARNIMLEFVRNEGDAAGCYILVPFNDVDNDVTRSESCTLIFWGFQILMQSLFWLRILHAEHYTIYQRVTYNYIYNIIETTGC